MSLYSSANHLICTRSNSPAGPSVPVSFLKGGETCIVDRISGREEVRKHLAGLGFVNGAKINVVTVSKTGTILEVKGSRIAVDETMASKIICTVCE